MSRELVALLDGKEVGRVHSDASGRLSFVYGDDWRQAPDAYPLSLSMPLAAREHRRAVVEAFLWGLLPDNEHVLARWAAKFQVSARNVFALISHVGEDCAGAIQFVPPDRLETIRSGKEDKVEWLDEYDIAQRLQTLRADHAAWRLPRDTGQFSLAGAQPKTALLLQKDRWGIPSGRLPTTHILKPPTGHFDGHAENEHICLVWGIRCQEAIFILFHSFSFSNSFVRPRRSHSSAPAARSERRRAERRSGMARLRATASAARSVLDGREHDGRMRRLGSDTLRIAGSRFPQSGEGARVGAPS